MQVDSEGFFHLTYCSNIHPGETLEEVEQNLEWYAVPLKAKLAPGKSFGIGLRLSDQAARSLADQSRLGAFKELLDRNGFYVFTLNGFPYGGFHRQVVKDEVYAPDWRQTERVDYTLRLIDVLSELLPPDQEGSISTSPISYKPWIPEAERDNVRDVGAVHLAQVAATLHELRERTGKLIHVGLEPEPDCFVEDSLETVRFFEDGLFLRGGRHLQKKHGMSKMMAEDVLREHIRVCYDTCHFAVEFESPGLAFSRLEQADVRPSKIQISAALRVPLDRGVSRDELARELDPFAESTYLHQVVARSAAGQLTRYPDLPQALPDLPKADAEEWRIHYHVPIFVEQFELLISTQRDIVSALEHVLRERSCPHLEIETYTWDVLPNALKTDVVASIEREYEWVLDRLALAVSR